MHGPAPMPPDWIVPDWNVPGVQALITTRHGGYSQGPFGAPGPAPVVPGFGDGGMNLGQGHDEPQAVERNRSALRALLPGEPVWLAQEHGVRVVDAAVQHAIAVADASYTLANAVVCAVLVADCLPVLLAESSGRGVAAVHAGWRGLAGGILQQSVATLRQACGPGARIVAFLGPAIGPSRFEVGPEVHEAMERQLPEAHRAFIPGRPGRYLADLFALARQALVGAGVAQVTGGGLCTASDPARFYSFRRDGTTGRHAALIWRNAGPLPPARR